MRFIVTGTGHCGTGYVAHLLRSAGINCGHEGVVDCFGEWSKDWALLEAECGWPVGHCTEWLWHSDVYHLVRHPLRVIRSWLYGAPAWDTAPDAWWQKRLGIGIEPGLEQCALRYVGWNQLIEDSEPVRRIQVERRVAILDEMGIERPAVPFDNIHANKHVNGPAEMTWQMIEAGVTPSSYRALREMGDRYGYE